MSLIGRILKLQPAYLLSVLGAAYAAGIMLYRALWAHTGVFNMDVLVAGLAALYGLWMHLQVTPLARPRDARRRPLVVGEVVDSHTHAPRRM